MFAHLVYLERIRINFIYEGHRVKVKVTETNKVKNPYSRNVKRRLAISTPAMKHSHKVCAQHRVFGYGGSNGVTAVFIT